MYDMELEASLGCLLMDVELHQQLGCVDLMRSFALIGHLYSRVVHDKDFN